VQADCVVKGSTNANQLDAFVMTTLWPRGSEWRRWDLHVHTPDSFEHNFGSWEDYLVALRAVRDVSVLGVTDYFFIDGYRKLRALREAGALSNFDAILPNIELRLGTFVPKRSDGTQLRRLNFHVIFSYDVSPDVIEQQFIQALHFQVDGNPEDNRGVRNVTRQAIEDVGRKIKEHQHTFASDSDFVAGCKVITFDLNEIKLVLQREVDPDYFYTLLGSRAVFAEFARRAPGATVKNLNIELVRGVTVPVAPVARQKEYARAVAVAEHARGPFEQSLKRLDDLFTSLQHRAFQGEL
jgi:hypothetical protein